DPRKSLAFSLQPHRRAKLIANTKAFIGENYIRKVNRHPIAPLRVVQDQMLKRMQIQQGTCFLPHVILKRVFHSRCVARSWPTVNAVGAAIGCESLQESDTV